MKSILLIMFLDYISVQFQLAIYQLYLLVIFPKNEKENLSMAERNILKKKIDILLEREV